MCKRIVYYKKIIIQEKLINQKKVNNMRLNIEITIIKIYMEGELNVFCKTFLEKNAELFGEFCISKLEKIAEVPVGHFLPTGYQCRHS